MLKSGPGPPTARRALVLGHQQIEQGQPWVACICISSRADAVHLPSNPSLHYLFLLTFNPLAELLCRSRANWSS